MVGDIHGKIHVADGILRIAAEDGYQYVIQVGDFGWWPTSGGNPYIAFCNKLAKELGIVLWVIDGNHDYPGKHQQDQRGYLHWRITEDNAQLPGLHWIPRNTTMMINDKRVAFIGGAVSVDRSHSEKNPYWFAEELLTDIDVAEAQALGEVDILISHDRWGIPPHFRQSAFAEHVMIALHNQHYRWSQIIPVLRPKIHFHGHFHDRYDSVDEEIEGCHTIGLGAEDWSSFVGFNFDTFEITNPEIIKEESK